MVNQIILSGLSNLALLLEESLQGAGVDGEFIILNTNSDALIRIKDLFTRSRVLVSPVVVNNYSSRAVLLRHVPGVCGIRDPSVLDVHITNKCYDKAILDIVDYHDFSSSVASSRGANHILLVGGVCRPHSSYGHPDDCVYHNALGMSDFS